MAPPILTLQDTHLTFGGTPLLEGAELSIGERERLCLVGRNGSGKSTLLKIAAGLIEADRCERFVQPGVTIRYLPQEPDLAGHDTVHDYVNEGLAPGDDPHRARTLLEHFGLSGGEDPATLSGGEARRAALARVLAAAPDILMLDEPTNHLDLPAIEWLERELAGTRSALVLISHDRRFLETLSQTTIWLDRGLTRRLGRGFGAFEAWRDETLEQEESDHHKLGRKIVREEHWLRYGVTARRKRNQKRLQALHDMRAKRRDFRRAAGGVKLTVMESEASGKLVIEAKNISKSFGDRPIVQDFSIQVRRGDRIGIVGPNGAGKTTLINLITSGLEPDAGTTRLGTRLDMVTLDQGREKLEPGWTVRDALTGGRGDMVHVNGKPKHVVSYMKDFLFQPEQANTPLHVLSGGERGRLMLARALAEPSNLMVLDEPTNDLDLETLDLLQEMLGDYAGTLLLVSHDRDFLDRVVTSVIAWDGTASDPRWVEYAGGYSDMAAQRSGAAPQAPEADAMARKPKSAPAPAQAKQKRKLSFNEKHALETLPQAIADLEAEAARLQEALADPELYARDPDRFSSTATALEAARQKLAQAEDRWLELEMLKQELEET
ncbi:MAG: ATP-binding cassette domain-containing protein [Hyphomicrobiales bacterium]